MCFPYYISFACHVLYRRRCRICRARCSHVPCLWTSKRHSCPSSRGLAPLALDNAQDRRVADTALYYGQQHTCLGVCNAAAKRAIFARLQVIISDGADARHPAAQPKPQLSGSISTQRWRHADLQRFFVAQHRQLDLAAVKRLRRRGKILRCRYLYRFDAHDDSAKNKRPLKNSAAYECVCAVGQPLVANILLIGRFETVRNRWFST